MAGVRIVDGRLRIAASDVANFVACRHLTRLPMPVAHLLVKAPRVKDIGAEALEAMGLENESQILAIFRARGWEVYDPCTGDGDTLWTASATESAIRGGAD